jgi:Cu+-exporting ATPase
MAIAISIDDKKLKSLEKEDVLCFHCGEACNDINNIADEKHFCCDGCKAVYLMLSENGLCSYYDIDDSKGISPKLAKSDEKFAYLDEAATVRSLLSFENEAEAHVTLSLPQIHCNSCVWLLEHLYKLNPGIVRSQTDFIRKNVAVVYEKEKTSLRRVVELLATLGYEPALNFVDLGAKTTTNPNRQRIYRLTVAGFCFGNIMMLSFPEYLSNGDVDPSMLHMFSYASLLLSLPVLIYSGGEFFVSAWQGVKARFINIDLPLSLSLAITFVRSVYEILSGTGMGYLDSMAGIIFFMLVGRFFQAKTHTNLQFDRDFRSFFPISVNKKSEGAEKSIPLANLHIKDRIIIRSQELIPADAVLISGDARIDYSFVTGESKPEHIGIGKVVYAGGRQTSGMLELEVVREVEQSHLTQLWNKENKKKSVSKMDNFVDRLGRRFGAFLILLSISSFIFWYPTDPARGIHALTTILIVACPCALLLSATFTHASIISLLGKNGAFVRQADVLEKTGLSKHIVWDKTGTITTKLEEAIQFNGVELNSEQQQMIMSLASQSNHPLSKAITSYLATRNVISLTAVSNFNEIPGGGIMAWIGQTEIKIGSATFVNAEYDSTKETRVYISINGEQSGHFSFGAGFRPQLKEVLKDLTIAGYHFSILSGDKSADKETLKEQFDSTTPMFFGQSPSEKLDYISALQSQGEEVIMVGDGLNDAGALLKSDVGIAISDDVNNFTPACDIIIEGKSFGNFHKLIRLIKASKKIVIASFILSLLYNVVGLGYAVRGELSPVLAAILMPVSTISIILFTTGVSRLWAMSLGLAIRRK